MAEKQKRAGSRERVRIYLEEHCLLDGLVEFEQSTKTAQMAAEAMECELGQIVKSLVFVVGDRPVLVLVAGDRRGDGDAIAALLGGDSARIADAETVRSATGYAIGGVSPFDLPVSLPVLFDDSLQRFDVVFPAGGTPSAMVRMSPQRLRELTRARVARISH